MGTSNIARRATAPSALAKGKSCTCIRLRAAGPAKPDTKKARAMADLYLTQCASNIDRIAHYARGVKRPILPSPDKPPF